MLVKFPGILWWSPFQDNSSKVEDKLSHLSLSITKKEKKCGSMSSGHLWILEATKVCYSSSVTPRLLVLSEALYKEGAATGPAAGQAALIFGPHNPVSQSC